MHDLVRASDLAAANNTIKVLNERLSEARALLSQYQIEFEVEVEPGFVVVITARKPHGGGGVRKTLSKEECLYFASDPGTLAHSVVSEIVEALLIPHLTSQLSPLLSRALQSVKALQVSKL